MKLPILECEDDLRRWGLHKRCRPVGERPITANKRIFAVVVYVYELCSVRMIGLDFSDFPEFLSKSEDVYRKAAVRPPDHSPTTAFGTPSPVRSVPIGIKSPPMSEYTNILLFRPSKRGHNLSVRDIDTFELRYSPYLSSAVLFRFLGQGGSWSASWRWPAPSAV